MMRHASHPDAHLVRLGAGTPIVFDCIQADAAQGLAFDIEYARHHLSSGQGRRPIRRYAAVAQASYLCIEELQASDLAAADSWSTDIATPAAARSHLRCLGLPLSAARRIDIGPQALEARYAYPIFFEVPLLWQEAFNDWYEREHVPMLLQCPQWLMCRRFALQDLHGCPWSHMALHYLADLSALESPERAAARSTPWRRELEQQPWFRFTYRLGIRLA